MRKDTGRIRGPATSRAHARIINLQAFMETGETEKKVKHPKRRILLWILAIFFGIAAIITYYLYSNFNRLLSEALVKSFNSGIVSDVYELKFEKLGVNLLLGDIQVYNVELTPREKPLRNYPYINSSLRLRTKKILLSNVEILNLLKKNKLAVERIDIMEPDIEVKLAGEKYILFPFKDTSAVAGQADSSRKHPIESYRLKEFGLVNASFHVINAARQREFNIRNLNISLEDLLVDQRPGRDIYSNRHLDLSIGEITWRLQKDAVRYISIKDYSIGIDTLDIQNSPDTSMFHFRDFSTGLKEFDMQTGDSLFHLTMQSLKLSYRDSSITLKDISFKPNISNADMQKRFTYQTPVFSGSVGTIRLVGLNFDSLIYARKLYIDDVALDKLSVTIFKDQSKPVNKNKFPGYPGQQIGGIDLPLLVKHVKATNVNLVNSERKPDGGTGKININRLTLDAKNITSLPSNERLVANADAYLENKAHAFLALGFSYKEPQFNLSGRVTTFNLPDLNPFLKSYTPGSIKKGVADDLRFSADISRTGSTGEMTLLYHDLDVDLALKDKAKWKSDVLAFAANTVLPSANPASANKPARVVRFHVDRDMNKGFINIMIKSVIAGLKETMIMSKENRKAYKEAKKEARKKSKQENK